MNQTQILFQSFLNTLSKEDILKNSLETINTDLTYWASLNILSIEDFNKKQDELQNHLLAISERDKSSKNIFALTMLLVD